MPWLVLLFGLMIAPLGIVSIFFIIIQPILLGTWSTLALIADTVVITLISLAVAVPLGVLAAVFLSEYCSKRVRAWLKPILEVLGGIPSVVYGFFALRVVTPLFQDAGLDVGFWNGLSAGVVMGFMILPLMASLAALLTEG